MRYMMALAGIIILVLIFQFGMSRPVQILASGSDDLCGGTAIIKSVSVSLKSRPSYFSRTLMQMDHEDGIILCENEGGWHGVIIQKKGMNCLNPNHPHGSYDGECISGWVHESKVEFFAG